MAILPMLSALIQLISLLRSPLSQTSAREQTTKRKDTDMVWTIKDLHPITKETSIEGIVLVEPPSKQNSVHEETFNK